MDATVGKCQVSSRGPTYKVDIIVGSVPTRGLLDHGAQVTLARKELLPMIREKLGWSKEQCHAHNLSLDVQPIGASVKPLGAIALVSLPIEIEETGASELIPCYVLEEKDNIKLFTETESSTCVDETL